MRSPSLSLSLHLHISAPHTIARQSVIYSLAALNY